jgi:DNA-binding transcriptional LysR family regulator
MAESLKAMAVEGHGLAFLPASAVRNELSSGRLVPAAPPGVYEVTMEIRLYRERSETARHRKPLAQALWSFLEAGGA